MEKKTITIPQEFSERIYNTVAKRFNVKDKYRLKDKLDGAFFLEKQILRLFPCYFIQKVLNIKLLDENKPLFCTTTFEYQNDHCFAIGTNDLLKIKIPKVNNVDYYMIFHVVESPPKVKYVGKISHKKCIELSSNSLRQGNNTVNQAPLVVTQLTDLQ